jgi:hypothetical protein
MTTPPSSPQRPNRVQVNLTLHDDEAQLLDAARLSWRQPGDVADRLETRASAAKRLVLDHLRGGKA